MFLVTILALGTPTTLTFDSPEEGMAAHDALVRDGFEIIPAIGRKFNVHFSRAFVFGEDYVPV